MVDLVGASNGCLNNQLTVRSQMHEKGDAYLVFLIHSRNTYWEMAFLQWQQKSSQLDKLVLLWAAESISQHME